MTRVSELECTMQGDFKCVAISTQSAVVSNGLCHTATSHNVLTLHHSPTTVTLPTHHLTLTYNQHTMCTTYIRCMHTPVLTTGHKHNLHPIEGQQCFTSQSLCHFNIARNPASLHSHPPLPSPPLPLPSSPLPSPSPPLPLPLLSPPSTHLPSRSLCTPNASGL